MSVAVSKNQIRYDRGDIRRLNAVGVLDQLRKHGSLSRAEIAEHQGLTRATVSNIVAELIEANFVKETNFVEGNAGRPGLLLELNSSCGCMIGVEINIDQITVVLSDMGQDFIWRGERLLDGKARQEDFLEQAETLVQRALEQGQKKELQCRGICVAWAGLVNHSKGELAYSPTLGWMNVPLRESWEKKFGVTVYLVNEAHAGAVKTYQFGKQENVKNLIYLSVGVGMAAGIYVDGSLLMGESGYAGQVGHAPFRHEGEACRCGKKGCWVTEVGSLAIMRKLERAGIELSERDKLCGEWVNKVVARAEEGDEKILEVLDEVGLCLGEGLTRFVNVFNPKLVVVGGSMGKLLKYSQKRIKQVLDSEILPHMGESLQLEVSQMEDDQLMGCIATIYDSVMKNPPLREENKKKLNRLN